MPAQTLTTAPPLCRVAATDDERLLARAMGCRWRWFLHTGDPNGLRDGAHDDALCAGGEGATHGGGVRWPRFQASDEATLLLDVGADGLVPTVGLMQRQCDLWRRVRRAPPSGAPYRAPLVALAALPAATSDASPASGALAVAGGLVVAGAVYGALVAASALVVHGARVLLCWQRRRQFSGHCRARLLEDAEFR